MATKTYVIVEYDNGNVKFEYDYDDVTLRISRVRGRVALGSAPMYGAVIRDSDGLMYEATFPAGFNTEVAVPTTGANRVQLTVDARGRLVGVQTPSKYPA